MKLNVNSDFLNKTQNSILSAAFILSAATAVNAVLGFVKGRCLAYYFGVSNDLAIFYTADRVPGLIYSILIVGAVSTVFIPIFSEELMKDKEKAFKTASAIISFVCLLFFVAGITIYIFSYQVTELLALGKFSAQELALGSSLMRIMLAAQLILVIGSLITSILQSFKYFLIPALAPVLYNLGMIGGIILLSTKFGIYGPAFGVLIGASLYLLIQVPLLKRTGFAFKFSLSLKDRGFKKVLSLVPPRLLSVTLASMVGTINNSLAILVSTPSVVFLKFGVQLQTFPVNLFGLSIASACLPTLSQESNKSDLTVFKKTLLTSFHQTMFLVLPISVILMVLRIPVVRIVYGVANFPWEATVKTSYVLAFFSLSVFAQSANYLLTRGFYALKDTKTPVITSLFTIVLNVALSILFVTNLKLGVWSVALSFSITACLDTILYLYFLSRKVHGFSMESLLKPFVKISYAAVIMGMALYIPVKFMDKYIFDTTHTLNLLILTGIAGSVGMIVYLVLTKLFKVEEIELLYKVLRRLNLIKPTVPASPALE